MVVLDSATAAAVVDVAPTDLRRVQRRTVGLLAGTQIAGGIGVASGIAVGALLAAELAGTEASGLAGSASVIGAAAIAVPVTRLTRARGRRPGLALAYLLGAVGAVVVVAAVAIRSSPLFFLGAFLFGGGSAAGLQARYAAVDLAGPGRRARYLSLVVWATTVGAVVGPNIAPVANRIGESHGLLGYVGPYLLSAVAFSLTAMALVTFLRPDPLLLARAAHRATAGPGGDDAVAGTGRLGVAAAEAGAVAGTGAVVARGAVVAGSGAAVAGDGAVAGTGAAVARGAVVAGTAGAAVAGDDAVAGTGAAVARGAVVAGTAGAAVARGRAVAGTGRQGDGAAGDDAPARSRTPAIAAGAGAEVSAVTSASAVSAAAVAGPVIAGASDVVAGPLVVAALVAPSGAGPGGAVAPGEVGGPGRRGRTAAGAWRVAWRAVRASPGARLGIAAVAVGHVVMVGVMSMTPVYIGGYEHDHADVLRVVGLVISIHITGMYALSPLVGWLADRLGRRAVILGGIGVLLCACAVAGTAGHSTPRLAVGLALIGLGWSGTMVAGSTLLSESVSLEVRPAAQGLCDVVMGVAGASAGALAGVIVDLAGYPTLTLLAAIATVPLAALASRSVAGRSGTLVECD